MAASTPGTEPRPVDDAPENRFFRSLGEWVLAHRWLLLAANVALTVLFGWAMTQLKTDMSSDPFLPEASPAKKDGGAVRIHKESGAKIVAHRAFHFGGPSIQKAHAR